MKSSALPVSAGAPIVFLVVLLGTSACSDASRAPAPRVASDRLGVHGRVIGDGGRPLEHFTIKVRAISELGPALGAIVVQDVDASPDGSFEVDDLPDGSYKIDGTAAGYALSFSEPFTASQGRTANEVLVRLTRGGSLSGRITDAYAHEPLAGAEVTTFTGDTLDPDLEEPFCAFESRALTHAKAQTDAEGRFRIERMIPGSYLVRVRAKSFAPHSWNSVAIVDEQLTELPPRALVHGATLSGFVYGRDTAICPGATVLLSPSDRDEFQIGRTASADDTGHFVLESVAPGFCELAAMRPNWSDGNGIEALYDMRESQLEISLADGEEAHHDLHMSAPKSR